MAEAAEGGAERQRLREGGREGGGEMVRAREPRNKLQQEVVQRTKHTPRTKQPHTHAYEHTCVHKPERRRKRVNLDCIPTPPYMSHCV